jgi:hypothetical protein
VGIFEYELSTQNVSWSSMSGCCVQCIRSGASLGRYARSSDWLHPHPACRNRYLARAAPRFLAICKRAHEATDASRLTSVCCCVPSIKHETGLVQNTLHADFHSHVR